MKKFIGFVLVVAILAGVGYGVYYYAFKDKSDHGDGEFAVTYEYLEYLDGYDIYKGEVTGYTGKAIKDVVLEGSFNDNGTTRDVTIIKARAFKDNNVIESVDINENIIDIELNAFQNCKNLKTVIIRNAYTTESTGGSGFYVDAMSFNGCDLSKITFKVVSEFAKTELLEDLGGTANIEVISE